VQMGTKALSGSGHQTLSMSREAVPNSNHCNRVRTTSEPSAMVGVLLFEERQWTAGMRKFGVYTLLRQMIDRCPYASADTTQPIRSPSFPT
jgi:hypothetical protein